MIKRDLWSLVCTPEELSPKGKTLCSNNIKSEEEGY